MKHNILGAACTGILIVASNAAQAVAISGQGTWESTLQGRDLDGNLATFEAYYDTILNITWLADANFARTSGYDPDGAMNWATATSWATNLNPYSSGITGWRLPTVNPVDGTTDDDLTFAYDGSEDRGYNVSAPGTLYAGSTASEMAHLFYNTLGDRAYYSTLGVLQAGYGLINTGPFSNLPSSNTSYWSGTSRTAYFMWAFSANGLQEPLNYIYPFYAWAVHDGDVGAAIPSSVPVPAASWLFCSGLLGLIGVVQRKRKPMTAS